MALSILYTPEILYSKSKCDNCMQVTSDSIFLSAGTYFQIDIRTLSFLLNPSNQFDLAGTVYTIVAGAPTVSTEIQDSADALTLAQNMAAAFAANLFGYSIVASVPSPSQSGVLITSYQPGSGYELVLTPITGFIAETHVDGEDAEVNDTCIVEYQAYVDNCPVFLNNRVMPLMAVRNGLCNASEEFNSLDLTYILKNIKSIRTPRPNEALTSISGGITGASQEPTRMKNLVMRFRECCAGVPGAWITNDDIFLLHVSCDCSKYPIDNYQPDVSGLTANSWLNFTGSHSLGKVCASIPYPIYIWIPAGESIDVVITETSVGSVIAGTVSNTTDTILRLDLSTMVPTYIPGIQNNAPFSINLTPSGGAPSGVYSDTLDFFWSSKDCCCEHITFLNCLGSYQTFYVNCETNRGIEVSTKEYITCEHCVSGRLSDFAKKAYDIRTYYTPKMQWTEDNKELLKQLLMSSEIYIGDDYETVWRISADSYSFKDAERRIQIPLLLKKSTEDTTLINP